MAQFTIAENMLYSTVKLAAFQNDVLKSTGTGFFFEFANNGTTSIPCIVTNKHVVKGMDKIVAICHTSKNDEPSGNVIITTINIGADGIFNHSDDAVDLCAIPFADIINQAINVGTPLFIRMLDIGLIPEEDDWQYFDAIEDVTMVGCPSGISDEKNNLPIIRRGITASPLSKDYNGRSEFMVDMACFPGSSGSPIFIYNRDGYLDRKKNAYQMGASRLKLAGVLYSGPQVTNTGQIVLAQPPKIVVPSMMHLGNAIKSSALLTIYEMIKKVASAQI